MPFKEARYKRLAHNDTGAAVGHQAGVLIPKPLSNYFPALPTTVTAAAPTVCQEITATLVVGAATVATVTTRYQHQTWGGKRRAERRITGELQPLLGAAHRDDLLLFEQDASNPLVLSAHPA